MSRRQNLISARVVNYKEPDWRPLERLASPYLASSFMWMFELARSVASASTPISTSKRGATSTST
jgi:hypothetical protein